jgi:putative nucleic acid binding protein
MSECPNIFSFAAYQGQREVAREGYEQSAKIYEDLGNNAAAQGDHGRAAQLHEQSRVARELAYRHSTFTGVDGTTVPDKTADKSDIYGNAAALGSALWTSWQMRRPRGREGTLIPSVQQEPATTEDRLPHGGLTARQLTAEYRSNPVATNRKYAENTLIVQGKVTTKGSGGFFLDAEANQDAQSRQAVGSWDLLCLTSSLPELASIQVGQVVTVRGKYREATLANPTLYECRIVSAEEAQLGASVLGRPIDGQANVGGSGGSNTASAASNILRSEAAKELGNLALKGAKWWLSRR